jgi:hypothetical protein
MRSSLVKFEKLTRDVGKSKCRPLLPRALRALLNATRP